MGHLAREHAHRAVAVQLGADVLRAERAPAARARRGFDEGRHPQPEVAPLAARRRLAPAERGHVDELADALQRLPRGGAAQRPSGHEARRRVAVVDDVAQAELERLDAELCRDHVDEPLPHERLGRPGPAVRHVARLVGDGDRLLEGQALDAVRAGHHRLHGPGHEVAHTRVGARVDEHAHLQGEDDPVRAHRHLDVEALLTRLPGRGEVLVAILDPLHRSTEVHRHGRARDLLAAVAHLEPERATDLLGDDADHRRVEAEPSRERGACQVHALTRDVHREPPRRVVEVGDDRPAFHRHVLVTVLGEVHLQHAVGAGERARDVAVDVRRRRRQDVRSEVLEDGGARRVDGRFRGHERGQLLVVDLDEIAGVLGEGPALGHHERDRITDESDLVGAQQGERRVGAADELLHPDGPRLDEGFDVFAGQHGHDTRCRASRFDVDADDESVAHDAAHERGVDHSLELHVIDVATTAREDSLVLEPPHPGARVSLTDGCHGGALLRKIGDAPRDVRERGTGRRVSSPRSECRFLPVRPARSAAAVSAPIKHTRGTVAR